MSPFQSRTFNLPRLPASSLSISCIWPKYRTKFFKICHHHQQLVHFCCCCFYSFVLWQYSAINFFTFIVLWTTKQRKESWMTVYCLYACDFQPSSFYFEFTHCVILRTAINMLNFFSCFVYSLSVCASSALWSTSHSMFFIYTQKVSQFYLHSHFFFLQTVWKKNHLHEEEYGNT